ncbi:MAG TPA: integrin alpha [Myxococcaceae bacterium]|jgi:hypothetical protein
MDTRNPKSRWSLLLSSLPAASLAWLTACGGPTDSVDAPSLGSSVAALDAAGPAWSLQGAWSGVAGSGAGGTASSFMQMTLTGDENGDGVDDFALGLPSASSEQGRQGRVVILSGANLAVLKTINGETVESFGYAVASLGDINQDGSIDYAVGAPVIREEDGTQSYRGRVYVLRSDAATGSYSRSVIQDEDPSGYFGRSLAFGGGNKDVLIVSRPNFKGGRALGYAVKYDHKEKPLYVASDELNNDSISERRGYFIEGVSDLDGDGTGDFVMNASGQDPAAATFPYPGRLYFHSGRTGELLRIVEGPDPKTQIGSFTSEIGDINADGVSDFLIGAPYTRENGIYMAGSAFVVDGAAVRAFPEKLLSLAAHPEAILRKHVGTSYISLLGHATSRLFDLNGDGVEEYAVGAPGVSLAGKPYAGQVLIYSGSTGEELHRMDGVVPFDWYGEGLRADPKSKSLFVGTWHANGYQGRMDLHRWGATAPVDAAQP